LTGFGCKPVFRFEDTGGEPLEYEQISIPELPLIQKALEWGISVKCIPGDYSYYGFYSAPRKEIALATPEEKVFFHELSHAAHEKVKGQLKSGQDPLQEIVAELSAASLCMLVGKTTNGTFGNSYKYIDPAMLLAEANKLLTENGRLIIISTDYGGTYQGSLDYCFVQLGRKLRQIRGMWRRYPFDLSDFPYDEEFCVVRFEDLAEASGFAMTKKFANSEDLTTYYLLEKQNEYDPRDVIALYERRVSQGEEAFFIFIEAGLTFYLDKIKEAEALVREHSLYHAYELRQEAEVVRVALQDARTLVGDERYERFQKIAEYVEVLIMNHLETIHFDLSFWLTRRISNGKDSLWGILDYNFEEMIKFREMVGRKDPISILIGTTFAYVDLGNIYLHGRCARPYHTSHIERRVIENVAYDERNNAVEQWMHFFDEEGLITLDSAIGKLLFKLIGNDYRVIKLPGSILSS